MSNFLKLHNMIKKYENDKSNCDICKGSGFVSKTSQKDIDNYMTRVKSLLDSNGSDEKNMFKLTKSDILSSLENPSQNGIFELCNYIAYRCAENQFHCKKCVKKEKEIRPFYEKYDSIMKSLYRLFNEESIWDSLLLDENVEVKKYLQSYDEVIRVFAEMYFKKIGNNSLRIEIFDLYDVISEKKDISFINRLDYIIFINCDITDTLTASNDTYLTHLLSHIKMKRKKTIIHSLKPLDNKFTMALGIEGIKTDKKQEDPVY